MIISLVIGVIMVVTAIIPLTNDYTDSTKELYNNAATSMAIVGDGEHTIIADAANMTLTIDGIEYTPTENRAVLMSDEINVLFQKTSNQIQIYSSKYSAGLRTVTGTATITITDKSISFVDSTMNDTYDCEWIYIFDQDGKYGMITLYNQAKTYYVNSINDVRGANILSATADWFSYEGADVKLESGSTVSNVSYTLTPVSGYTDLYQITLGSNGNYSFEVDNSGTPYTVHPWVVVLPLEITAHKPGSEYNGLVSIIPLMAFVGLIAVAATMIYLKGKE